MTAGIQCMCILEGKVASTNQPCKKVNCILRYEPLKIVNITLYCQFTAVVSLLLLHVSYVVASRPDFSTLRPGLEASIC